MRARLLVLAAAVGFALLTGCGGEPDEPEVAAPKTNVSFKPAPTYTAPEPTRGGAGVVPWWAGGGEDLVNGTISAARRAYAEHEADKMVIDLSFLSGRLTEAKTYASIPDAKAMESWTKAREQLNTGMHKVAAASADALPKLEPERAAEVSAAGWADIGSGIETLKDTYAQLKDLGCVPAYASDDPWV
nr:hypothetical protein OG409_21830 [Streptomyces sp. NBC_00974]